MLLVVAAVAGCDRAKVEEPSSRPSAPPPPTPVEIAPLSDRLTRTAPERLVAIGDLHGDLDHARRALRLAGAIDERDAWIGGKLMVVQTGDEIDRGDGDRRILDLFERLKVEARAAGGEVIALLGNHELMNVALDFRYVTPGGFAAFSMLTATDGGVVPSQVDPNARGRAAAFLPGGTYASLLARRPLVMKVGDTLFVHGGVLPKHVAYGLDKMNDEVDEWLAGKRAEPPAIVMSDDGPVWTRVYSDDEKPPACATLTQALARTGTKRMVVGHTVQKRGVSSACDGKVWRIDVGLARHFGGPIEVLVVAGDAVSVQKE